MTYAELIKVLFEASGVQQINEYADRVSVSRAHMSNILGGKQPGSAAILDKCLKDAGKRDALQLEAEEPDSRMETEALRLFKHLDDESRAAFLLLLRGHQVLPRGKRPSHKRDQDSLR